MRSKINVSLQSILKGRDISRINDWRSSAFTTREKSFSPEDQVMIFQLNITMSKKIIHTWINCSQYYL